MKKEKNETGMTYHSLMNHFINYPNHPEWLHKLFSPLSVMLISAIFVIFLGYVILGINLGLTCILTSIMLYIFSRGIIMMKGMSGHGVGLNVKQVSKTRKILIRSVIILSILAGLAFYFGFRAYLKSDNIVFLFLPSILIWGLIGLFLIWKYHMYFVTWYGNEYDARKEFKDKGMLDQDIDIMIKALRRNGTLPTSNEEN